MLYSFIYLLPAYSWKLCLDNGFLVNQVGTPLATQIEWDTPPLAVGYHYPFVVGVQNNIIQVPVMLFDGSFPSTS